MGLLGDAPWLDETPAPDAGGSSLRRGLRSGFTGAQGQLAAFAGGAGEMFGQTEYARSMYDRSRELAAQAATEAPPISSYRQVDTSSVPGFLSTGYDYVTGQIGSSIPSSAAAIAAGLLTRRPIVGGMATLAPVETGDILQRQQADPAQAARPVSERLSDAVAGGLLSGGLQTIVPAGVTGQILGRTAALAAKNPMGTVGRAALNVPMEAGAEASSEFVKQRMTGQDDPQAIREAAVGGAAAGGAMAVPGAVAEYAHGRASAAGTSAGELLDSGVAKAKEMASGAVEAGKAAKAKVSTRLGDLFNRENRPDEDIARDLSEDRLLDPMGEGDDPKEAVNRSDAKATKWVTDKLEGLLADSNVDEETKTKAREMLANVSDYSTRAEVGTMETVRKLRTDAKSLLDTVSKHEKVKPVIAGAKDVMDTISKYRASFESKTINERVAETQAAAGRLINDPDVTDDIKKRVKAGIEHAGDTAYQAFVTTAAQALNYKDAFMQKMVDLPEFQSIFKGGKKSEDFSEMRRVIRDQVLPAIMKKHPKLDPEDPAIDHLVEALRVFLRQAKGGEVKNKQTVNALLVSMLGDDGHQIIRSLHEAERSDNITENENLFRVLDEMRGITKADLDLTSFVRSKLKKPKEARPGDLRQLVKNLRSYADGSAFEGMGPAQRDYDEADFHDAMTKTFTDPDSVLERFENEYLQRKEDVKIGDKAKEDDDSEDSGSDNAKDEAEADTVEHNLEVRELELEEGKYYPGDRFILSPEAHISKYGNTNSEVSRLLTKAERENPSRQVSFVSAKEFLDERLEMLRDRNDDGDDAEIAKLEAARAAMGENIGNYGVVEARGEKNDSRIPASVAERMRLDSRNHGGSTSRIDTKRSKVTLDALRITREMRRWLPRQEGESTMQHTARAFFEGLSAALDYFGTTVDGELSESTLVTYRNGKPVTVAMLRAERFAPREKSENDPKENLKEEGGVKDLTDENVRDLFLDLHHRYDRLYERFQRSMMDEVYFNKQYKSWYERRDGGDRKIDEEQLKVIRSKFFNQWRRSKAVAGLEKLMFKTENELKSRGSRDTSAGLTQHYFGPGALHVAERGLKVEPFGNYATQMYSREDGAGHGVDARGRFKTVKAFDSNAKDASGAEIPALTSFAEDKVELGLRKVAPDAEIHRAEREHGEGNVVVKRDLAGDKVGFDDNKVSLAAQQVASEREKMIADTKDKPLATLTVPTRLVDENGRELVWKGKDEEHPGRMDAEAAAREIHQRKENFKKLLACVKGK